MKKPKSILILLIISSCISCKNLTKNKITDSNINTLSNKYMFDLNTSREKFKFEHLNSFSMDSIDWEKRKNHYKKLTEIEFFSIYQDSLRNYQGDYEQSIDLEFYYSIQNRKSDFNEITILWQKEGEYCDGITYLIFDNKGKIIDRFPVAGSCGDGGYYDEKYGEFLNDSIYKMTYEDYNERDEPEIGIKRVFERFYTISKNGKVKMNEKLISTDTLR